ncbi:hypothetical protein T06_550, partial [Trichinella sp. T6]
LDNEGTAINVDELNMVPPISEAAVEKPVIKDEPKLEDTVAKDAESSQIPKTDIISPKIALDNEVTAINVDQLNMVPPIAVEAVDKAVVKDEPQGERKDSKKIKKKSKKRSKSKK